MSDYREAALDSLYHQAVTDKVKAEATLHILLDFNYHSLLQH